VPDPRLTELPLEPVHLESSRQYMRLLQALSGLRSESVYLLNAKRLNGFLLQSRFHFYEPLESVDELFDVAALMSGYLIEETEIDDDGLPVGHGRDGDGRPVGPSRLASA
jgi:hypothetical protein